MFRHQKYNHLVKNFQISKLSIYADKNLIDIANIELQGGHFKPNNLYMEHGLLLSNITGLAPKIELFKHGKRQRNTVIIKSSASSRWKWAILNNFLHIIIPSIGDLQSFKIKRSNITNITYSWRIRNFFEWEESNILLSDRILKKNVFLPLFFNITLQTNTNNKIHNFIETVLRMHRLPFIFYKSTNFLLN